MNVGYIHSIAQSTKIAPFVRGLALIFIGMDLILTRQHKETIEEFLLQSGNHTRQVHLDRGNEIAGLLHMLSWFLRMLLKFLRLSSDFVRKNDKINNFMLARDV
jgi:hypothetical protein